MEMKYYVVSSTVKIGSSIVPSRVLYISPTDWLWLDLDFEHMGLAGFKDRSNADFICRSFKLTGLNAVTVNQEQLDHLIRSANREQ